MIMILMMLMVVIAKYTNETLLVETIERRRRSVGNNHFGLAIIVAAVFVVEMCFCSYLVVTSLNRYFNWR